MDDGIKTTTDTPKPKQRRGFAAMSLEKRRALAAAGGKASHAKGTGHKWTTEEAREAGRRGGAASHASGKGHRWTVEEARTLGKTSRQKGFEP